MKDAREAFRVAESVASRDRNNLYLTSRFLADPARYDAFCAFYAVMRVVDDAVDDLMEQSPVTADDRDRIAREVAAWQQLLDYACEDRPPSAVSVDPGDVPHGVPLLAAFRSANRRFPVPRLLWDEFFAAMHRDLEGREFETFEEFTAYAEGASVAPTTIYLVLLASRPQADSQTYEIPSDFDVIECGRNLGLFAYLAHILRDLPKDLAAGDRGLLYLARDDMEAFGVTLAGLRTDLARGRASASVQRLLEELAGRSETYLDEGRRMLNSLQDRLTPDCRFVLALIVKIYREILRRIEAEGFDPFSGRHLLELEDKKELALQTARESGLPIETLLARGVFGPPSP